MPVSTQEMGSSPPSSSRSGGVIVNGLTSGYYNTYFVGGIRCKF
ncbi:MAG: hypothetical protein ACLTYN_11655 [Dysosmobacter welbionis]